MKTYLSPSQLWSIKNHVDVRYDGMLVELNEYQDGNFKDSRVLVTFIGENDTFYYNEKTAKLFHIEFINNLL